MSCQATHTTLSENGGSPLKCEHLLLDRSGSLRKMSQEDEQRVVVPELRVQENRSEEAQLARSLDRLPCLDNCGLQAPRNGLSASEQILDSHTLQKSNADSRFLCPPAALR